MYKNVLECYEIVDTEGNACTVSYEFHLHPQKYIQNTILLNHNDKIQHYIKKQNLRLIHISTGKAFNIQFLQI